MTVPHRVTSCDLEALSIDEREHFVLSKVDGRRSIGDLAALTGLTKETIAPILGRLIELRAIWIAGPLTTHASASGGWSSAGGLVEVIPLDVEIDWALDDDLPTMPYAERPSQRITLRRISIIEGD
jgi:hypothetical protein